MPANREKCVAAVEALSNKKSSRSYANVFSLLVLCFGYGLPANLMADEFDASDEDSPSYLRFYGHPALQVKRKGPASLTPFFSRTITGLDLIARDVAEAGIELSTVLVGAGDHGFHPEAFTGEFEKSAAESFLVPKVSGEPNPNRSNGAHGSGTVNLINGKAPVGAAVKATINALVKIRSSDDLRAARQIFDQAAPDLINLSLAPDVSEDESYRANQPEIDSLADLEKLANRFILSVAAGNRFPRRSGFSEGRIRAFVAQSATYNGFLTFSNQESGFLGIWVPSDFYIKTVTDDKKQIAVSEDVSQSSAAVALLTGAIANVLSVRKLEYKDLLSLLIVTAIRTVNSHQSLEMRRNGFGLLNAYKMFRVAVEMARAHNNETAFNFSSEVQSLLIDGQKLLKSDLGRDRKKGFDKIRRAFLLDPSSESARAIIIEIYNREKMTADAEFYQNLSLSELESSIEEKLKSSDYISDHLAQSAARTAALLPNPLSAKRLLQLAFKHPSANVKSVAVYASRDLAPADGVELLTQAMEHLIGNDDEEVRLAICQTVLFYRRKSIGLDGLGITGGRYLNAQVRKSTLDLDKMSVLLNLAAKLEEAKAN